MSEDPDEGGARIGNDELEELNQLMRVIDSHDERGLVLSLAAFAEDTLGRLLVAYLREPKQAKELVEGFNAPLGTLAARVKAAFCVGLLSREQHDDLEVLRRVRNAFAHDWQGVSFQRNDIKALIGQMNAYTLNGKGAVGDEKTRISESIKTILVELRVQIAQHKKYQRQAPVVGFRLIAGKSEDSPSAAE